MKSVTIDMSTFEYTESFWLPLHTTCSVVTPFSVLLLSNGLKMRILQLFRYTTLNFNSTNIKHQTTLSQFTITFSSRRVALC